MSWLALALLTTTLGAAPVAPGRWLDPVKVQGEIDGVSFEAPVVVYLPSGHTTEGAPGRKLLVALHGWAHAPEDFRKHTRLAALADELGLVVVLPAMGKTVYETKLYPETKGAWGKVPGARWVAEVVLPWARKTYGAGRDKATTGILGYSTGGRGAVVVAERWPEFGFVASLSGTYALRELPVTMGESKIHAAVFGDLARFPERWVLDDAVRPGLQEALSGVKVVLAHGGKDPVVPPEQMERMRKFLEGSKAIVAVDLDKPAGHDWAFWDRAIEWALRQW